VPLFTIAIAFVLLAMAKERTEYRYKTAALIDRLPPGRRRNLTVREDGGCFFAPTLIAFVVTA
jgi:hypothetical protein